MTHEPNSTPTSTPAWALIHLATNGACYVTASTLAVTLLTDDEGFTTEQLGLPTPDHVGFWLWKGTVEFDGLDDVELRTDQPMELLSYGGAGIRMTQHEPVPDDHWASQD